MKIATMVRGYLPVPRPKDIVYAPIDLAVALSKGLKTHGHTVTFYAPRGKKTNFPITHHGLRPLVENQAQWSKFLHNVELHMNHIPHMWDFYLAQKMFEQADKGVYDILHFHHPQIAMPFAAQYPNVPVVYTLHDPLSSMLFDKILPMFTSPNQFFVSISDSQRIPMPKLNYAATIHNGVDTSLFKPRKAKRDRYLLYVGRIIPQKGLKEAIKVAIKTGYKLLIAGPLYPESRAYFNKHVKPYLGEQIQYLGYIERNKLLPLYQGATALLMPIRWEEPFGMNMIEAMACGTPVIALDRGSVPEVVVHNKTGFITHNLKEMVAAVEKIDTIKRQACRDHISNNFSTERMVDGYEKVFEQIIKNFTPIQTSKS